MARKCVPFKVVVHVPVNMDYGRMQAAFDKFYIEQAKKILESSGLDKAGKIEIIDRVAAQYKQSKRKSA